MKITVTIDNCHYYPPQYAIPLWGKSKTNYRL